MAEKKKASKVIRSSKADRLVEIYREIGFTPVNSDKGAVAVGNDSWLAPVSFLPHVDYTISSVIGGI